jgi:predicted DNA-binding transcriptional regulator AlpA
MKPISQAIIVEQLPPRVQTLDRFLSKHDVLRHIGLSNTTLYKLIKDGNFPKQIRIKHCTNVVWSEFAVHQWMEEQKGGVE